MATNVLMPQLGESIAEGTILRWNKKVGEHVDRDEPLFEISTDKVDAEIPSPVAGVVAEIRVAEGETVPIDSVVAVISQTDSHDSHTDESESSDSVATGRSVASAADGVTERAAPLAGVGESNRGQTSPVVRRLAREHNIDLATIHGTGAGGRVTKSDVLAEVATVKSESGRRETMSVMRRRIAEHMVASRRTSAHVHTVFDVDFSRVAELRSTKKVEYEQSGAKLTYLSFIGKAVVAALGELPIVNSSLDGDDIVYKEDINLGVAVALDWGLIVPVVKRAQEKTTIELSRCISDLSERARTKKLKPEDVDGGTFTITNPGVFGSILGLPIINQPQVAILCVGSVEKRPVVVDDTVVPRTRAYLTLGFDHRVIDGAVADRFMNVVKRNLEHFDESLL